MTDFWIKQGNTERPFRVQLTDSQDDPVDVTGAAITFKMKRFGEDGIVVSGSVDIVDAPEGIVEYDWQEGDTDEPGKFAAEWDVDYEVDGVETFPNGGINVVRIFENVQ